MESNNSEVLLLRLAIDHIDCFVKSTKDLVVCFLAFVAEVPVQVLYDELPHGSYYECHLVLYTNMILFWGLNYVTSEEQLIGFDEKHQSLVFDFWVEEARHKEYHIPLVLIDLDNERFFVMDQPQGYLLFVRHKLWLEGLERFGHTRLHFLE